MGDTDRSKVARAFVPPWQLQNSSLPHDRAHGVPELTSHRPSTGAPPVPPRGATYDQTSRRFPSHFVGPSSSIANLASPFSAYSSPFLSSYGSPLFRSTGSTHWDSAASSSVPRLGALDPLSGHPWLNSATPAFEGVESLVMTVRSISIMVESTYQALHSSFCVILSVADHFAKLKTHLVSLLSSLSLLKLFKWILDRFLTHLRLKATDKTKTHPVAGKESTWSHDFASATSTSDISTGGAAPTVSTHWPLIAFFGLALGAPWLLWKMLPSTRTSDDRESTTTSASSSSSSSASSPPWHRGVGEHFVAKAQFDFRATAADEISFEKDDLLKIAPKQLQTSGPKGWYLASKDGTKVGYVPANHVEVLVKLEGKSQ